MARGIKTNYITDEEIWTDDGNKSFKHSDYDGISICVSGFNVSAPVSPVYGDAYIDIGGQLFIRNNTSGWELYQPSSGARIIDKSNGRKYYYDGSAWIPDPSTVITGNAAPSGTAYMSGQLYYDTSSPVWVEYVFINGSWVESGNSFDSASGEFSSEVVDESIIVNQAGHGFSVLNEVYISGSLAFLADASDPLKFPQYTISEVIDSDNFKIKNRGRVIKPSHGLVVGEYYSSDPSTPGGVILSAAIVTGQYDCPSFHVVDADTVELLNIRRPELIEDVLGAIEFDIIEVKTLNTDVSAAGTIASVSWTDLIPGEEYVLDVFMKHKTNDGNFSYITVFQNGSSLGLIAEDVNNASIGTSTTGKSIAFTATGVGPFTDLSITAGGTLDANHAILSGSTFKLTRIKSNISALGVDFVSSSSGAADQNKSVKLDQFGRLDKSFDSGKNFIYCTKSATVAIASTTVTTFNADTVVYDDSGVWDGSSVSKLVTGATTWAYTIPRTGRYEFSVAATINDISTEGFYCLGLGYLDAVEIFRTNQARRGLDVAGSSAHIARTITIECTAGQEFTFGVFVNTSGCTMGGFDKYNFVQVREI